LNALCFGLAALALRSRRLPTPRRRRPRSRAEREAFGLRTSRTTASRSSSKDQQRLAQSYRNGFRHRGPRRLQSVRRVAAVVNAVAVTPLIHRCSVLPTVLTGPMRAPHWTGSNRPYLWCRRRLFEMMDQHGRTPSRVSLWTDFAVKNADRRGAM
jgi:hypothetical protein